MSVDSLRLKEFGKVKILRKNQGFLLFRTDIVEIRDKKGPTWPCTTTT